MKSVCQCGGHSEHVWFQWVENRSYMAEEDLVVEDVVNGAGVEDGEGDLK